MTELRQVCRNENRFLCPEKIDCACGNIIDVRTDKLSGRVCPHRGNVVVFDQSKGERARCPICPEPINPLAEQSQMVEFSCAQCGVRLRTAKGAEICTCPVCDCVNDVSERLMSEKIRTDGLASIIRYEGADETLVWKHPIEDFNMAPSSSSIRARRSSSSGAARPWTCSARGGTHGEPAAPAFGAVLPVYH